MIEILSALCIINFTEVPVRVINMKTEHLPTTRTNKFPSDTWLVQQSNGKQVRVLGDRCRATEIVEISNEVNN